MRNPCGEYRGDEDTLFFLRTSHRMRLIFRPFREGNRGAPDLTLLATHGQNQWAGRNLAAFLAPKEQKHGRRKMQPPGMCFRQLILTMRTFTCGVRRKEITPFSICGVNKPASSFPKALCEIRASDGARKAERKANQANRANSIDPPRNE